MQEYSIVYVGYTYVKAKHIIMAQVIIVLCLT
jgi:hypothetical protein